MVLVRGRIYTHAAVSRLSTNRQTTPHLLHHLIFKLWGMQNTGSVSQLQKEFEACRRAGLDVEWMTDSIGLPFTDIKVRACECACALMRKNI